MEFRMKVPVLQIKFYSHLFQNYMTTIRLKAALTILTELAPYYCLKITSAIKPAIYVI